MCVIGKSVKISRVSKRCGIEAWRVNTASGWYGHLRSVYKDYWYPLDAPAVGKRVTKDGETGIWAYKTFKQARSKFSHMSPYTLVYVKVLLYGTVVEHERGYRAQYARVVGVRPFRSFYRERAKAAAEAYKCQLIGSR